MHKHCGLNTLVQNSSTNLLKGDFVNALPQGQYVKHYRYGFGVITESNEEGTSIEFETHGSKKFVTSLMEVELSNLTPPKPFRGKWIKSAPPARPSRAAVARKAPEVATVAQPRNAGYFLSRRQTAKTVATPSRRERKSDARHLEKS
jgi:hypothetical protein